MDDLFALASKPSSKLGVVLIEDSCFQSCFPILSRFTGVERRSVNGLGDSTSALVENFVETVMFTSDYSALFKKISGMDTCIVPVQTDLIDAPTLAKLEYLANVIVRVAPLEVENSPHKALATLVQRRAGGKSSKALRFTFDIEPSGLATKFTTFSPEMKTHKEAVPAESKALPMSSFNLGMTEGQRAMKDALVLPYIRMSLADDKPSVAEERKILAPDFDDEDPDDDLDI